MRRKGFTLIELLVVIAIIAILAAMLFPVFARARESARKIQCLSNVKNVAMAMQLYLTDYDRFWPFGNGQKEAVQWTSDNCGTCRAACFPTEMNPYLRVPVILDEYVKNRDVWRCPSAQFSGQTTGVQINACEPDWYTWFARSKAAGCRAQPCDSPFPPGWGGSCTDSALQQTCGFDGFDQSIGLTWSVRGQKLGVFHDLSRTVVCGDAGISLEDNNSKTSQYAYPDYSRFDFLLLAGATGCTGGSAGNCSNQSSCGDASVAATCSPLSVCFGGDGKFATDPSERIKHSRHLGGSNLGFADGHAQWVPAEKILFGGYDLSHHAIHPQVFYGVASCFNPTAQSRWDFPVPVDPTAGLL
jgi:prepilin-type N-terminal cleavage/methylation domain-containing protein/prepilin-type processing-associated H-X9-DG protein